MRSSIAALTDSPKIVFNNEHNIDMTTISELPVIPPPLSLSLTVSFTTFTLKQRLSVFSLIFSHSNSSVPSQKQVDNLLAVSCLIKISREFLHLLEHFPPLNIAWQFLL